MLSLPPVDSKVQSKYDSLGRKTNKMGSNSSRKKILERRLPVPSTGSCFCIGSIETREEIERRPLFLEKTQGGGNVMLLKEGRDDADDDNKVVAGNHRRLEIRMKPQIVMLRVSMHCNGCAKKVEKHVSKIEGVSCYKVDLESKMVVIIGDVVPVEVLESVSKIKRAEFWGTPN